MRQFLCLAMFFALVPSGYCSDASEVKNIDQLPSIVWERTFGAGNLEYENQSLKISSEPEELIIAGKSLKVAKDDLQQEGVWVWKIDGTGHKKTEVNLKKIKVGKSSAILKATKSIVKSDDETIMLLSKSDREETVLLKVSFKGEVIYSKKLESNKRLTKILPTSDNAFLLIGEEKGYPYLLKIDATGSELWSKVFEQHKYGKFIDGIPEKDGGFILVENSGASTMPILDTPDIFITKYNAKGEKENERYLPGRYGNLVVGKDSLALLYDKSHASAHDYWVQKLNNDLTVMWDRNISSNIFGFYNYKIAVLQNGDYILAGSMEATGKTWLAYLDSSGSMRWNYLGKTEYAVATDVACSASTCFLVESIPTLQTRETEVRKIRVVKFKP